MDDGLMTGRALCVELAILDLKVALNTGLAIRPVGTVKQCRWGIRHQGRRLFCLYFV